VKAWYTSQGDKEHLFFLLYKMARRFQPEFHQSPVSVKVCMTGVQVASSVCFISMCPNMERCRERWRYSRPSHFIIPHILDIPR